MRLLTLPANHDVFWVVFGWALLYGYVRALLTDGSAASIQMFDDSLWPPGNKDTLYHIHGTNEPWTIGTNVSSGCIRLTNEDVVELYNRARVGTKVVVLNTAAPATTGALPSHLNSLLR